MVTLSLQSQYATALSQSIRNERFRRKRKSLPDSQPQTPTRFCISKHTVVEASSGLTEEESEKHVAELQKEWRSPSCSAAHITMLFKETYINIRQWLPTLPSGRLAPILEKFPCLEEGSYVSIAVSCACCSCCSSCSLAQSKVQVL